MKLLSHHDSSVFKWHPIANGCFEYDPVPYCIKCAYRAHTMMGRLCLQCAYEIEMWSIQFEKENTYFQERIIGPLNEKIESIS